LLRRAAPAEDTCSFEQEYCALSQSAVTQASRICG